MIKVKVATIIGYNIVFSIIEMEKIFAEIFCNNNSNATIIS